MAERVDFDNIIIDGSDLMYRSFFALPPLMSPDGFPTSAITGTLNMIERLQKRFSGSVIIVFDPPTTNHRHAMHAEYKLHRKPMPDELRRQWQPAIALLIHMGFKVIQKDHYESDDVIATLAKKFQDEGLITLIVSHDKDIAQCVSKHTYLYLPTKDKLFDELAIFEKWQIHPNQIRDYLVLVGDASDGFEGVLGIGNKTAVKLLNQYGNLQGLWDNRGEVAGKVGQNLCASEALLSRNVKLASLVDDVELLDADWQYKPDAAQAAILLQSYGMGRRITKNIQLPSWNLLDFSHDALPQSGPRYWYVALVDKTADLYQLCLWHATGVWSSCLHIENLKAMVQQIHWCEMDHWWETIFIYRLGIDLPKTVVDVSLLLYAIDSGKVYKNLMDAYVSQNPQALGSKELADVIATDQYYPYHAYVLFQVHESIEKNDLYETLERPLVPILASMEERGIKVDASYLHVLAEEMLQRMGECQRHVDKVAGYVVNLLSPLQLRRWIYEEMKAPAKIKTQQGQWSTSEEALEELIAEYPILQQVSEYRMLAKLRSTYCEGLIKLIDDHQRLHTHYDQRGTITGRFSSSEPNLQNIPNRSDLGRKVRQAFVAKEGFVLLSADYSQIELRLMAHFSQDALMCNALKEGADIHQQTASWLFNKPLTEVSSDDRRFAKTINFGLLYGMSAYGLARQLHLSTSDAKDMIERYFSVYPALRSYREEKLLQAMQDGFITTLMGKRVSLDRNAKNRGWMERLALNAPMQGSAAEIIKLAMLAVSEHPWQDNCCLLLQVHDELIFEVSTRHLDDVIPWIYKTMSSVVSLHVPLDLGIKVGKNWGNMHRVDA